MLLIVALGAYNKQQEIWCVGYLTHSSYVCGVIVYGFGLDSVIV